MAFAFRLEAGIQRPRHKADREQRQDKTDPGKAPWPAPISCSCQVTHGRAQATITNTKQCDGDNDTGNHDAAPFTTTAQRGKATRAGDQDEVKKMMPMPE